MVKNLKKQEHSHETVRYYYDYHWEEGEEELMGTGFLHSLLLDYLKSVLRQLFLGKDALVLSELNFYGTAFEYESQICPDIALLKGVGEVQAVEELLSWSIPERGQAPQVVFEIASPKTWEKDVESKSALYTLLGVQEYFFYAPKPSLLGRRFVSPQLLGWQRNESSGQLESMRPDQRGRLWSQQLESQLLPDGIMLRLSDGAGHLRLTQAEAADQAKELALHREEAERRAKEAALHREEAERRAKEAALHRAEALAQRLRALGIDPDSL